MPHNPMDMGPWIHNKIEGPIPFYFFLDSQYEARRADVGTGGLLQLNSNLQSSRPDSKSKIKESHASHSWNSSRLSTPTAVFPKQRGMYSEIVSSLAGIYPRLHNL